MPGELVLIDSNILIRWTQREAPSFVIVRAAIRHLAQAGAGLCYTSQNLAEFWNILTRPIDRNGFGFPPAIADIRTRDIEDAFRLLPDIPAVHQQWRKLLVENHVSGVQVHDARLAASMLVHGVHKILTFNTRDVVRFTGIEAIHPFQIATS
jgi:predicted nucleic acid-binding protein